MEMIRNEIGSYTISDKAFADIATIACTKTKNVYPTKKDGEFVTCKFNSDNELTVTVSIRVKQGVDIVKLCSRLQNEINDEILMMCGVECKKINIDIQGFEKK